MNKLCIVVTIPFTLNAFVRRHLDRLVKDYDCTVCLNMNDSEISPIVPPGVRLVQLGIVREISLWADLRTLVTLSGFFRHEKFDLVLSMTPKGGLLGMVAAKLSGVPRRVHCFTGQVWATRRGFWRWLLKGMDRVLALCATRLLTDSASQRQYLIDQGITPSEKLEVLANGSMAGVDVRRFSPNASARSRIRRHMGIDDDACCLLFVGRMTKAKGVADLIAAFNRLSTNHPTLHLILVGPAEEQIEELLPRTPRLHRVGYSKVVEDYMAASDVFCLPSYREGFGLVLIEAGAVGLPVVASRIYGITDAVVDGETGLLHQPGNVDELAAKLDILIMDAALRSALGAAGKARSRKMFSEELVCTALAEFISRQLDTAVGVQFGGR